MPSGTALGLHGRNFQVELPPGFTDSSASNVRPASSARPGHGDLSLLEDEGNDMPTRAGAAGCRIAWSRRAVSPQRALAPLEPSCSKLVDWRCEARSLREEGVEVWSELMDVLPMESWHEAGERFPWITACSSHEPRANSEQGAGSGEMWAGSEVGWE